MSALKAVSPFQRAKRLLLGAPIPSSKAHHERLSPWLGLPVFSSDALSSVAYATEAILQVLIRKSSAVLMDQIWISAAIVALIIIITFSYKQTITAYPSGGGSYIVASENLGETPGLIAGAALLIDYILTVSVSIAAGVQAIISALPSLKDHIPNAPVSLSLLFIGLVAFANLRGMRESGVLFAIPTYGFIFSMFAVIAFGIWKVATTPVIGHHVYAEGLLETEKNFAMTFIVLRAFAAGCTALTGIEAVSNGVQAFKAPEAKNATKTLFIMSALLTFMFLGLGYLALQLPQHYSNFSILEGTNPQYITLTAQVAAFAFGPGSVPFYIVQGSVAAILILAANTAFADFPRLASLIARDGYLPRYLSRQGDRLVFHNGIIVLAFAAGLLIVKYNGLLDNLLPLYAVGVFTAFSLSQGGMVKHWIKEQGPGWKQSAVINFIGMLLCIGVLGIIGVTKFAEGAWLVMILIPMIYALFMAIKLRYRSMAAQLEVTSALPKHESSEHFVLVLVPRVHRGILSAVEYAKQLTGTYQAVHVTINEKALPDLQRNWENFGSDVPLVVLPSPYRSLIAPVLDYVDKIRAENPGATITVIVTEAVSTKWYQKLLTENVAQQLKMSLARRSRVVVANVRYFLN